MKYTPGPWIAKPEVAWSGGTWNINTEDEKGVASAWPGQLGADAAKANARLIAEAPALLEACKIATAYLDDEKYQPDISDGYGWAVHDRATTAISAAITKATEQ